MPHTPQVGKRVPSGADANNTATAPTQSLGIREAQADKNPADPTRKVHPDSVPLAGAPQPSRRDLVMPSAEPVVPEIDETSTTVRSASRPMNSRRTRGESGRRRPRTPSKPRK